MAKPIIAYLSMLRLYTVADPGTATGYSIASLYDMRPSKIWKSNTTVKPINIDIDAGSDVANADYIGLVNHNLFTLGATVKVMANTAAQGSPATNQVMAATAVTEDTVSLLPMTAPGVKRYWRIQITVAGASFAAAPFIGECYMGMKTTLNEYMTPAFDPFFDQVEVAGSRSEGGHYLGATTRGHLHRGMISFGEAGAARADFTSDLNAFIDNHAALRKPFFFQLDSADTDFDYARFVRVTDTGVIERMAVGETWSRLVFALPVEEAYAEPVA